MVNSQNTLRLRVISYDSDVVGQNGQIGDIYCFAVLKCCSEGAATADYGSLSNYGQSIGRAYFQMRLSLGKSTGNGSISTLQV